MYIFKGLPVFTCVIFLDPQNRSLYSYVCSESNLLCIRLTFLITVTKYLINTTSGKEYLVWLTVTIIVARKAWPQEHERSGHIEQAVRKQRMNAGLSSPSSFHSAWDSSLCLTLPLPTVAFSTSVKPFKNHPHQHTTEVSSYSESKSCQVDRGDQPRYSVTVLFTQP